MKVAMLLQFPQGSPNISRAQVVIGPGLFCCTISGQLQGKYLVYLQAVADLPHCLVLWPLGPGHTAFLGSLFSAWYC